MGEFGVPQLPVKHQHDKLIVELPNEFPLFTALAQLSRKIEELPFIGAWARLDKLSSPINTLNRAAIALTAIWLIIIVLNYLNRASNPAAMRNIAQLVLFIAAVWAVIGADKLYERTFITRLELTSTHLHIIEQRPWGTLELATVPIQEALDFEIERAYTDTDEEMGAKRRCNLYLHHQGRRMRLARGMLEELCIQTANTIRLRAEQAPSSPHKLPS